MFKTSVMRAVLLAIAATWIFATLTGEAAAAFPTQPNKPIPSELRLLVAEAHRLADALDNDPCYTITNETLARTKQVLDALATYYAASTALAGDSEARDYIDDVGTYLRQSRENFYDDVDYEECEPRYYRTLVPLIAAQFRFEIAGGAGQLRRPDFASALALESSGKIVNPTFGSVTRNDDYRYLDVNGVYRIPSNRIFDQVIFGYHYGTATNHSSWDAISTDGYRLNIYSPQGPAGGLGGGVSVSGIGGFADLTKSRYADDYSEQLGYIGLQLKPWKIGQLETSIAPYAKLIAGYNRESSTYGGTTAGGLVDFNYNNQITTLRYGAELGVHIDQPLTDKFGLYWNGGVRLIGDKTTADSTVNFGGVLSATEGASVDADKFNTGYVVGGGFYLQSGRATFKAGAAVESWPVATLQYSNNAPVTVEYKARDSFSATFGLKYSF